MTVPIKFNYIFLGTLVQSAVVGQPTGHMYWGSISERERKIQRANPDGTNVEDLIVGLCLDPFAVAIDSAADYLYWTDGAQDKILRCNRDGTNMVTLFTATDFIAPGIALDQSGQKIYWTDLEASRVRRMNLDGSNVETVVASTASPGALVIHPGENRLYWAQRIGGKIRRANLDGSDVADVLTGLGSNTWGMDIDLTTNKLYWGQSGGKLRRASTDGSELEDIVITSPAASPIGVTLDVTGGKVYWSTPHSIPAVIQRANLDGSNAEIVVATWAAGGALAFDQSTGVVYSAASGISRINPTTSSVDFIVFGGLDGPQGLVIDLMNDVIYWSGLAGVYHSNLDGNSVTSLTTQLNIAYDVALDETNNTLYWTELFPGSIRRMNVAGPLVEDVVLDLPFPRGVDVDTVAQRVYWTQDDKVRRANLDGTQIEDLYVVPFGTPAALALDQPMNQMYWTCPGLRRSKLDGSNGEVLIPSGLCLADALYVTSLPRRLYWSDNFTGVGQIRRANTDMSGITNLVTMPYGTLVSAIAFDCVPYRFGDIDLTGIVDLDDLIIELNGFADPQQYPDGDLYPCGGDDVIDIDDLIVFLEAFAGNELCAGPCL
ncbi:MAG: DUF5050 domain-containing protein [Planctomycetota bacterium]